MIEISTYLRDTNGEFVEIGDYTGPLPDTKYIEGALDLTVNGVTIIDRSMHDSIEELWAYVSNMVEILTSGRDRASTKFPDQPIELAIARQGSARVLVKLSVPGFPERNIRGRVIPASPAIKRGASANEEELLSILREHGTRFFRKMQTLGPPTRATRTR